MKMLIYNKKLQYYNIIKIFKSALKCTAVYHLLKLIINYKFSLKTLQP